MKFSEKLQSLRKKEGLSQEQLAERLNVTRQAISKWETGEGMPDVDNLLPLARLLHTTVDYLLDEEAQPQTAQPRSQTGDFWQQIKVFARRYGYWSGYVLAAIGAVRLVYTLIALVAAGTFIKPFGGADVWGVSFGFSVPYYLLSAVQILINAALIAGGLWLAKWLKRKYAE